MADKRYPKGLYAKAPSENAPDFVKAKLNVKKNDLIAWLKSESPKPNEKGEEWINLQVLVSKSGSWYCEVDDWQPENSKGTAMSDDDFEEDVPF